ncbi:MAG: hypothetical protein DHS20C16_11260 [Phycisphaerae bacterium]|nr:MAG: hypothetical protein DHS20C16_11260 [Phycisphaerae bacterium]
MQTKCHTKPSETQLGQSEPSQSKTAHAKGIVNAQIRLLQLIAKRIAEKWSADQQMNAKSKKE